MAKNLDEAENMANLDFDDETLKAIAEVYKNEGNEEYRKKEFSNAIHFYTEGIKVNCKDEEMNAKLYSNRATAHFYQGNYHESLNDARVAVELHPTYIKAIARGASACVELGLYAEAITWCDKGLTINQNNRMLFDLRCRSVVEIKATKPETTASTPASETVIDQQNMKSLETYRDDIKKWIDCYESCLKKATETGDRSTESNTSYCLGEVYGVQGDFKKAICYFERCLKLAKEMEDKSREGRLCASLGHAYNSLGDFRKAIYYCERCLQFATNIKDKPVEGVEYSKLENPYLGFGDFQTAISCYKFCLKRLAKRKYRCIERERSVYSCLGHAYHELGYFKKAINYHEHHLKIAKEMEDKNAELSAYHNLGSAYDSLRDFKKAIFYHEHCLKIARDVENRFREGDAYDNLGNAYQGLGDAKKALAYHENSLQIARETGDKLREGRTYGNLGNAYQGLGDVKKALAYHEKSLQIARETRDELGEGRTYGNLGRAHFSLGDFKKAIDYHERNLTIAKRVGNRYDEGVTCGNLGNAYHSLGEFKKAIDYHEHFLQISRDVENRFGERKAYGDLGTAFFRLGDLKKAIEYHELSLKIAKELNDRSGEGLAYGNLGNAYFHLKSFKIGIDCYERRLKIAKEIRDRYGEGHAYGNLGNAYKILGDAKKAIEYYERQLKISKKVGAKATEGKVYCNLGITYFEIGEVQKGLEYVELSLKIAKQVEDVVLAGSSYVNLGVIHESLGSLHEALECFQASVNTYNEVRIRLQSKDDWKVKLRDMHQLAYTALLRVLLKLDRSVEALCAAEKGRAQALNDLMECYFRIQRPKTMSSTEEETTQGIISGIPFNTIFLAFDQGVLNLWVIQNGKDVCRRVKEVGDLNTPDCAVDSLQELVERTFVSIGVRTVVNCEDRSLGELRKPSLTKESSYQTQSHSPQSWQHQLRRLYDVIMDPIADLIHGDEIVIVPEGPLWLVPCAALMDPSSRYLSDSFRIRVIPSLTSLKLILDCPVDYHSKSGALVVGDPWVQEVINDEGQKLDQLPFARREVEMIGRILNTAPLTGKEATKNEVLKRLSTVALVHIAAHGRMETGEIALCPNPSRACWVPKDEDFLLTISDVMNVKLTARLVVLSCCHSGRGEIKAEGVVGIARAFLGAGARSVLVSLWAIDDEATLEFMKFFYQHLVEGKSAGEALNQAMKYMRESENFSEVKYWAPFVLIGDDVTLEFAGSD